MADFRSIVETELTTLCADNKCSYNTNLLDLFNIVFDDGENTVTYVTGGTLDIQINSITSQSPVVLNISSSSPSYDDIVNIVVDDNNTLNANILALAKAIIYYNALKKCISDNLNNDNGLNILSQRLNDLETDMDNLMANINIVINESNEENDKRKEFEREKNKLITLVSKNENINSKYRRDTLYFYIYLILLILYTFGLSGLYYMGIYDMNNKLFPVVLISLSLFVILLLVIIDSYQLAKRKTYENFVQTTITSENWTNMSLLYDEIMELNVKNYMNLVNKVYNDASNGTMTMERKQIINSILNDFNNVNYVNMRKYQITDYKIYEKRANNNFMKYTAFVISIIGLMAGFRLRNPETFDVWYLYGITALLLLILFVVKLLHIKQNMLRKKYNWNKIYWNLKATNKYD